MGTRSDQPADAQREQYLQTDGHYVTLADTCLAGIYHCTMEMHEVNLSDENLRFTEEQVDEMLERNGPIERVLEEWEILYGKVEEYNQSEEPETAHKLNLLQPLIDELYTRTLELLNDEDRKTSMTVDFEEYFDDEDEPVDKRPPSIRFAAIGGKITLATRDLEPGEHDGWATLGAADLAYAKDSWREIVNLIERSNTYIFHGDSDQERFKGHDNPVDELEVICMDLQEQCRALRVFLDTGYIEDRDYELEDDESELV